MEQSNKIEVHNINGRVNIHLHKSDKDPEKDNNDKNHRGTLILIAVITSLGGIVAAWVSAQKPDHPGPPIIINQGPQTGQPQTTAQGQDGLPPADLTTSQNNENPDPGTSAPSSHPSEQLKNLSFADDYVTFVRTESVYEERNNFFELRSIEGESAEIEKIDRIQKNQNGEVEKIWIKLRAQ